MMRAFVDAAIELPLTKIELYFSKVQPDAVPELTRLVYAGAIQHLTIITVARALFVDGADTDEFFAAVRASTSLTDIEVRAFAQRFAPESVEAAMDFIGRRTTQRRARG